MSIEIVAIIAGGLLLFGLIFLASRWSSGLDKKYFQSRWERIERTFRAEEVGPRMAVIDADKLLDHALKQSGFKGETMADRMRSAEASLKNYDAVWSAHKLRNKLVHEQDMVLSNNHAREALRIFQRALKGLGAL